MLTGGTKLGPYEILSHLGAGGMGEVYLARDDRLDRDVASKVSPETMSRDRERVLRFECETLAQPLNPSRSAEDHHRSRHRQMARPKDWLRRERGTV